MGCWKVRLSEIIGIEIDDAGLLRERGIGMSLTLEGWRQGGVDARNRVIKIGWREIGWCIE